MSVLDVAKAVYDRLVVSTGAGTFYAAVGGRIYHLEAPEQTALPLCVYGIADGASPARNFNGTDDERYIFQFEIWTDVQESTPDTSAFGIEDKLRQQLDRQILTASNYDRLTCLCIDRGNPTKDGDAVMVSSQYEVKGTRTS